MNDKFKGVVIDAGHGGADSGAVGNGIVEKELNLKIATYIHNRLDELGIPNQLVRISDETLEPKDRVNRILSYYGNGDDVIVLSNHINAGGGEGAEIIYALRNSDELSRLIAFELMNIGRNVRKYYQRRYPNDYSRDYYFIHRNTGNTQPVLVEYGFLDNINDANLLKSNWRDYAEAVVKALASYLGVNYNNNEAGSYIVQKGDSLWSISKKFGISVDRLKELNNLSSNLLSIGQKILVSEDVPVDDNYYIVKAGDTLYSIAARYGIGVNKLKDINNLNSNVLSVGQKLLVKEDEIPEEVIDDNYDIYVVQKGDSLYSIAAKYNTSVNNLKEINNLSGNLLNIGMKLLVPQSEKSYYVVKAGDTLYGIAKNNNITVTEIVNLNNLKSANLSIGQELLLPVNK